MTFQDLVRHSPKLAQIKAEAKRLLQDEHDPRHWDYYESLKAQMRSCVGAYAVSGLPDFMYTSEAYDIAHTSIFWGLA